MIYDNDKRIKRHGIRVFQIGFFFFFFFFFVGGGGQPQEWIKRSEKKEAR